MCEEKVISGSPKIKEVKIIKTNTISEFEGNINSAIEDGWELYGEPCLNALDGFYSTMVKYEEVLK